MSAPQPITVEQWCRAYRDGGSPAALLGALLRRLAARQDDPAWILVARPDDLAAQLAALERRAAGAASPAQRERALPLYGVPFAVKDNIDIAGQPTTAACPAWARVAARSARAVEALVEAGAVWVGKTNLDQFATGLVGTRSPYGRPASVFDADRVSGGSSSGSAVAVARGDVAFALGTDTAGSGRVPAGFNHLVGLKPTPGRVSTAGVLPACRTLDCVSVFAHTVGDAAAVLAVIEGDDPHDAYSAFAPGPRALPQRLRVGVPRGAAFAGHDGYDAAWAAALQALADQGHEPVPMDFSALHAVAGLLYDGPWVAERHAVVRELLASNPQAFDPSVRRILEAAHRHSATDAFRGQYRLRDAQREAAWTWQQADVLMVPTAPAHPRFAQVDADPVGVNAQLGRYTNFVNLLGWCALALPAGFTAQGLPFGVTFIAPGGHDAALARWGSGWERALDLPLAPTARSAALRLQDLPHPGATRLPWPAVEPVMHIAVVRARPTGRPRDGALVERGATLLETAETAPHYRLLALQGPAAAEPVLVRASTDAGDARSGRSIAVEVWALPQREVGAFLAPIAPPLGLGPIELADGRWVRGVLCDADAARGNPDVGDCWDGQACQAPSGAPPGPELHAGTPRA